MGEQFYLRSQLDRLTVEFTERVTRRVHEELVPLFMNLYRHSDLTDEQAGRRWAEAVELLFAEEQARLEAALHEIAVEGSA